MLRIVTMCVALLLIATPMLAQVNVNLAWDASSTVGTTENPVKYYLYRCSDAAMTQCTQLDAGTNLTYGPLALPHQSQTWFYATARMFAWSSETGGTIDYGSLLESGKSNILAVRAFAPPGNPSRNRITVTQVGKGNEGSPVDLMASTDLR